MALGNRDVVAAIATVVWDGLNFTYQVNRGFGGLDRTAGEVAGCVDLDLDATAACAASEGVADASFYFTDPTLPALLTMGAVSASLVVVAGVSRVRVCMINAAAAKADFSFNVIVLRAI